MATIGVSVAVPEPWGAELQRYRVGLGDQSAAGIPTHITLLPPVDVEDDLLPVIEQHLQATARQITSFPVRLRGTGSFRPISPVVFLTMIVTIPAGMSMSIVNVAARSILLHRTPGYVRGQVIASQGLIGNIIGLVPTLLAGLATDLFGVIPVAVGIAVLIITGGVYARHLGNTRSDDSEKVALAPA